MSRWFNRHSISTPLLLGLLVLLILLCLTMDSLELTLGLRSDLSFNALTTPSATTEEVVAEVTVPVHIYAVFPKGEEDQYLLEVLKRYHSMNALISWEQTDVTMNPGLVTRFQSDIDKPVSQRCLIVYCEQTGRYRIIQELSFLAISYDTTLEAYDVSGLTYEKSISEALIYVTREAIPEVAILQGHGELDANSSAFFADYLVTNNYAVSYINLLNGDTLENKDLLIILSPQRDMMMTELNLINEYISQGGSLFITCDPNDPIENMPNTLSLYRLYGFTPIEGIVVADVDEAGTYYDSYPYALLPSMQDTSLTTNLIASSESMLLFVMARAFETPESVDSHLSYETLLLSGSKSYLAGLETLEKKEGSDTKAFALSLAASRLMETTVLSQAVIVGNSGFLTDSNHYAISDSGPFLLKMVQHLTNQDAISLSISHKPAVRPGLSASSQTLGMILIIAIPVIVLLIAMIVLLPRRHR